MREKRNAKEVLAHMSRRAGKPSAVSKDSWIQTGVTLGFNGDKDGL